MNNNKVNKVNNVKLVAAQAQVPYPEVTDCQWVGGDNSSGLWITRTPCSEPLAVVRGQRRCYCQNHLWQVYKEGTAKSKNPRKLIQQRKLFDIETLFTEACEELIYEGEI